MLRRERAVCAVRGQYTLGYSTHETRHSTHDSPRRCCLSLALPRHEAPTWVRSTVEAWHGTAQVGQCRPRLVPVPRPLRRYCLGPARHGRSPRARSAHPEPTRSQPHEAQGCDRGGELGRPQEVRRASNRLGPPPPRPHRGGSGAAQRRRRRGSRRPAPPAAAWCV